MFRWERFLCLGLVMATVVLSRAESPTTEPDEDSTEEPAVCEPGLADACFDDVTENLLCHLLTPQGEHCDMRTAKDLCVGLDDALNCTSGMIDTNCHEEDGLYTFDVWLTGLRAMQLDLCEGDNLDAMHTLLNNTRCWSLMKFTKCVENKANITHISDLMTTDLSAYECNRLQLAVGVCSADAEKNRWYCRDKADVIHHALAVFFSATNCGALTFNCRRLQKTIGPTSAAVLATLVITAVVLALLGLLLFKKGIVALNSARLRNGGTDDADGAPEDYSRLT